MPIVIIVWRVLCRGVLRLHVVVVGAVFVEIGEAVVGRFAALGRQRVDADGGEKADATPARIADECRRDAARKRRARRRDLLDAVLLPVRECDLGVK